jgi:hypothetical protein
VQNRHLASELRRIYTGVNIREPESGETQHPRAFPPDLPEQTIE